MLCLQCKLVKHNNHICSDLGPAALTQRQQVTADQANITENVKQVEGLLLQCHEVTFLCCL